ncbi:MAG: BamA/TamA family outer membrane protein [Bryobacterales bacterium]|nr:BamA/TamA family outer membrane protein [Bryobacterales bacterium]
MTDATYRWSRPALYSSPRRVLLTAIALIVVSSLVFGAPSDFYGKPVEEIVLVPRRQPLPVDNMIELIGVPPSTPLSAEVVQGVIERLYRSGRFEQIQVEAAALDSGGVQLRIVTEHRWFIGNVHVEGVEAPPNPGELRNATKLTLGGEFTQRQQDAAVEAIETVLDKNGYYGSEVLPVHEYFDQTQQVNITFYVRTGERAKYDTPVFVSDAELKANKLVNVSNWERWWGLFGWKGVTESRTQAGISNIRRYFQKQNYLKAAVRLQDINYSPEKNVVNPRVEVQPGSKVKVVVEGAKLSGGKRRELIPIFEEQSVDRDLLVEGSHNLEEYFETRGYFNADISFDSETATDGTQEVVYHIDPGPRKRLVDIRIEGNSFFSTKDILERLYVLPASLQFRRGRLSEGYLREDESTIRSLYLTNGFRDIDVDYTIENNFGGKEDQIGLTFHIHEGAQVFVGSLKINGVKPEELEDIGKMLTTLESQPFSVVNATADRDNILAYFYNLGYPNASFDFKVLTTDSENLVNVVYEVNRGEQTFVREVLVSGLNVTDPELVYKRIELFQGQPLSQNAMVETQRRLYDLGIFANVAMAVQNPNGEEKSKYVLFQLDESKRYSATFGFGAELGRIGGSSENLRSAGGEANFSPRVQFELTRLNLMGIAHSLSFRTRVSSIQQRVLVNYLAPQFRSNENLNLAVTAVGDQSRDVRTYTSRRFEGSVQLGQKLNLARNILYRVAWRQTGIDESTLQVQPSLIPVLAQPAKVGIISATLIEDKRDDPTDSTRGIYTSLDFGLASKVLLSGSDFGRFLGRNSTYHRLSSKLVLARTTTFGLLEPTSSRFRDKTGFNIPLPERFFAGGAASHRGFSENQAGPRDLVTGFPIGGETVFVNGVELRFPLIGQNLGGVLFHDAGNVYSSLSNFSFRVKQKNIEDFNYMVHAVGFGIRYQTPIGPFRVDIAYALNPTDFVGFRGTREELIDLSLPELLARRERQSLGHFQFHFSLGQSF